jgi:choline kinase
MRAIILVAGRGSRLPKHLSKDPKSFLKVGKNTIIEKLIQNFLLAGIKKIALVTGYKQNKFIKFKLKTFYNQKWKNTNMVYSLNKASRWLATHNCIVSYGDIFYEKKAIENLLKDKNPLTISYDPFWKKLWDKRFSNPLSDAETFKITKNKKIIEIGKKTSKINDIQGQYMGLMKFEPKGWKNFKKCLKKDFNNDFDNLYLTDVFQKLIENKISIKASRYNGKWAEVDSKKDYLVMKKIFKD